MAPVVGEDRALTRSGEGVSLRLHSQHLIKSALKLLWMFGALPQRPSVFLEVGIPSVAIAIAEEIELKRCRLGSGWSLSLDPRLYVPLA